MIYKWSGSKDLDAYKMSTRSVESMAQLEWNRL